ncbi:MAG: hypothetical protein KGN76_01965 [Acidobacteriota bacterium]|nr:hypothetical protein [Acidobacteriota bacterium]
MHTGTRSRGWRRAAVAVVLAGAVGLTACGRPDRRAESTSPAGGTAGTLPIEEAVRSYIRLARQLARLDPDAVETDFAPPADAGPGGIAPSSLVPVIEAAEALRDAMRARPPAAGGPSTALRWAVLRGQVDALAIQARMAAGGRLPFDEEARALFGIAPLPDSRPDEEQARRALDRLLPGRGDLAARVAAFETRVQIPRDRLPAVFAAALAACRQRTAAHVVLPPGERFTVQYVTGQPWSAYNRYRGHYQSVIQVNTDRPVSVERVLDLACHEGYPGHHLFHVLREEQLVRGRGWSEFAIGTLMSPQGLLEEAVANEAVDIAFPGDDRLAFERTVLYPLAGLDGSLAARADAVRRLTARLAPVTTDVARDYLDGVIDAAAARRALARRGAMPDPAGMLDFIDRYRSYVVAYTAGRDLVRRFLEAHGGTADHPGRRWTLFLSLATAPRPPADLAPTVR